MNGLIFDLGGSPVYVAFPRVLAAAAIAALLTACSSSSGTVPTALTPSTLTPSSASQAAAAASRGTLDHAKKTALTANPAGLEFASGATAAQTVTVSGHGGGTFGVAISGTGNCPTVAPAKLTLKGHDEDGDRDRDRRDASSGIITVTPAGAGPASCVIALTSAKHGEGDDEHDGDRDHHDRDHHDGDHHGPAAPVLTIPVTVDAPVATPTPLPTPTPAPTCGARGC